MNAETVVCPQLFRFSVVALKAMRHAQRGVEAPARLFAQVASNAGLCLSVTLANSILCSIREA